MGQFKPQLIMRSLVPVVMASILAIYGLVVSVLIVSSSKLKIIQYKFHFIVTPGTYSLYQ